MEKENKQTKKVIKALRRYIDMDERTKKVTKVYSYLILGILVSIFVYVLYNNWILGQNRSILSLIELSFLIIAMVVMRYELYKDNKENGKLHNRA